MAIIHKREHFWVEVRWMSSYLLWLILLNSLRFTEMFQLSCFCHTTSILTCNHLPYRLVQSFRGVLKKRCSEYKQQIYRRTRMPMCDFNKNLCNFIEITHQHGCSPVNLLHIFRTTFSNDTSGGLLLATLRVSVDIYIFCYYFWRCFLNCWIIFQSY